MWGHPRTGNGDQDLVAKMMVMIMMRSFRGVSHPFNRILSLSLSLSLSWRALGMWKWCVVSVVTESCDGRDGAC